MAKDSSSSGRWPRPSAPGIVDVARGAQPMASDDGRLQLIFNGEIYNHPQLMPELQAEWR